MKYLPVIIVIALTFGICFLADFGFKKLFRNKAQHKSGLCVKANKRYAVFGLIAVALGVAALVSINGYGVWVIIAGAAMILLGLALILYFLSFGIYYDDDSFIYSSFGHKNRVYRFEDIEAQQLYASGASLVIELHLTNQQTIQLQSSMDGVNAFMNKAFHGWLRQTGKTVEECSYYDPRNYCWFPNAQEE